MLKGLKNKFDKHIRVDLGPVKINHTPKKDKKNKPQPTAAPVISPVVSNPVPPQPEPQPQNIELNQENAELKATVASQASRLSALEARLLEATTANAENAVQQREREEALTRENAELKAEIVTQTTRISGLETAIQDMRRVNEQLRDISNKQREDNKALSEKLDLLLATLNKKTEQKREMGEEEYVFVGKSRKVGGAGFFTETAENETAKATASKSKNDKPIFSPSPV